MSLLLKLVFDLSRIGWGDVEENLGNFRLDRYTALYCSLDKFSGSK
jgi:hypothetical protein